MVMQPNVTVMVFNSDNYSGGDNSDIHNDRADRIDVRCGGEMLSMVVLIN
jgi:hypothetical protein